MPDDSSKPLSNLFKEKYSVSSFLDNEISYMYQNQLKTVNLLYISLSQVLAAYGLHTSFTDVFVQPSKEKCSKCSNREGFEGINLTRLY